jgi:hypothetical protein
MMTTAKRKKKKVVSIDPNSPIAQGLLKMVLHKRLRYRFKRGEITLLELNQLLKEKGIPRYYDNPATV